MHVTSVQTSNYYLNNLARHIPAEDVRLFAVTLAGAGEFCTELEAMGVPCWALNASNRASYPRVILRLAQILRREAIDILHLHLFEPTLLGLLAAALVGRPTIVTRHHSDAIHRLPAGPRKAAYLALEGWISRRARHIIAPSRRVREILTEVEGVSPAKVSVIPYGQTTDRFDRVRSEAPLAIRRELGAGKPYLVCVSRLHEEKGHPFLLEAFSRLRRDFPEATLDLVGTGPEQGSLTALIQRAGLGESVRLLGWRDDALRIMWSADLIVHPSLHEALPSAVIEAVMLGRPLVATDVSGVRDVLGDGEYGFIVPPADPEALWRAMSAALSGLDEARQRAERGRVHVRVYMDAERVAREYVARYQSVAAEPR